MLPIFAAVASFAPFLGVIHWAKVINPAYRGTPKKVTTFGSDEEIKSILQGDLSRCLKPPVYFRTKVPFWPGLS